jgi:hypothetical protein
MSLANVKLLAPRSRLGVASQALREAPSDRRQPMHDGSHARTLAGADLIPNTVSERTSAELISHGRAIP